MSTPNTNARLTGEVRMPTTLADDELMQIWKLMNAPDQRDRKHDQALLDELGTDKVFLPTETLERRLHLRPDLYAEEVLALLADIADVDCASHVTKRPRAKDPVCWHEDGFDAVGLVVTLIVAERLGVPVDPRPLVGVLRPRIARKPYLTRPELVIFFVRSR